MWQANVIAGQPQVAVPATDGHTWQPEAVTWGDFAALLLELYAAASLSDPEAGGGPQETALLTTRQLLPGNNEPTRAVSRAAEQDPGGHEPGTLSPGERVHAAKRILSSPAIPRGQQAGSGEASVTAVTPGPTSNLEEDNLPARPGGELQPGHQAAVGLGAAQLPDTVSSYLLAAWPPATTQGESYLPGNGKSMSDGFAVTSRSPDLDSVPAAPLAPGTDMRQSVLLTGISPGGQEGGAGEGYRPAAKELSGPRIWPPTPGAAQGDLLPEAVGIESGRPGAQSPVRWTGLPSGSHGLATAGPQAQPDFRAVWPDAGGPHTLAVSNGSFPVGWEQASVPGAAGGQSTPQAQAGSPHEPAHLLAGQPLPGNNEPSRAASPAAEQGPGAREPGTSSSAEPVQAATRILSSPAILPGQQAGSGETAATAATPCPTSGPEEKNLPAKPAGGPRPGHQAAVGPDTAPSTDTASQSSFTARAPAATGWAQGPDYLPGHGQGAANGSTINDSRPVLGDYPPARPAPGTTTLQPAFLPADGYSEPVAALGRTRRPGSNMAAGESSNILQQPEKVAGPTTSPGPPLARQVAEALVARSHLWQAPGRTKLEIQLEPKFLGRVEVQIISEGGKLAAQILVQSHQVRHLLEANLVQLNHNLQQQGLHFDHLSVDVDSGPGSSSYWGQQQWANGYQGGEQHRYWYPAFPMSSVPRGMLAEHAVAQPVSGAIDYLV